jgi:predicted ATP-grasp superfamily ATP-dependent carboligase
MQDPISVLIPDAHSPVALNAMRCLARSPNVKLHLLSGKRWNQCRFSRHRSSYEFRSPTTDDGERFKVTVDLVKRHDIDVILPVSIGATKFVATKEQALSELVALPSVPNLQAMEIARNKWLMTELARKYDVPVPQSVLVTLDAAFYQQLSHLEYPVLLKPAIAQGGRGIRRFEDSSSLKKFLKEQDKEQFESKYLVQNYIPGSTLGLNVLCREGEILAYTIQKYVIFKGFEPPTAIQFIEQDDVLEHGRKLVSALGWSGFANIDMRHDSRNGQVKLLEVNPRCWATLLGSLVVGVNFPYLACLEALDIPFPVPQYQLGKYVRLGTSVKETLRRFVGKNSLDKFAFRESDLKFFLADPMPELVDFAARGVHYCYDRRLVHPKPFGSLAGFLADWFPSEFPRSSRT